MSKLLEEATLEELEQAIEARQINNHKPRIDKILALNEEIELLSERRIELRNQLIQLHYSQEECPYKLAHSVTNGELCPLCEEYCLK